MIAIGPLRNAALLVKQAASVDALSAGRLTLGLAVGARLDDYEAAGVDHRGRGPRLSEQLAALRDGDDLGVRRDLPLLVGGMVGPAFARHGALRRRLRARRRPAARVRPRGGQRARRVERPRPPGAPAAVGPGLLRARRRGRAGRGVPARLLRVHRPLRGEDRRRQPHLRARDSRLRARLRGGRLRRAHPLPHRRRPRSARSVSPRCWRESAHHRRRPGRPLPGDPAQEGRPHPRRRRHRAQRTRRDVRLGRRVLRGDARRAARRRPREPPADHRHVRALARDRHPLPRAGCCARAATPSRPSRASCCCTSSSCARASSASSCASIPR